MSAERQDLTVKDSFKFESQKSQTYSSSHDDSSLSMSSFSFGEGIGINWRTFNQLQLSERKSSPTRISCVQPPSSTPLQTWFTKKCKFFAKDSTRSHHDTTSINQFERDVIDDVGTSDRNVEHCSNQNETLYFSVSSET